MTALPNGLHTLPRERYDELDRVNWSTLKVMGKSPAHYRHQLMSPKTGDTDARKMGRVAHLAVFEPERMRAEVAVYEGKRDKRVKAYASFLAKHDGKEILTPEQHAWCVAVGQAARNSNMAAPYLGGGKAEVTLLWDLVSPEIEGLPGYTMPCKSRLDFITNTGPIVDLKTTIDASPSAFAQQAARYEYHAQAAFYVDACEAATGVKRPYVIVAVEKAAPHLVQVYRVPDEILEIGRDRYRELADHLNMCRRDALWPGYAQTEMEMTLPKWALPAEDEDASGLGLDFGTTNTNEEE